MGISIAAIRSLEIDDLRAIADALRIGRLASPFTTAGMQRLGCANAAVIAAELQELTASGWSASHIADLLDAIHGERTAHARTGEVVDLVWTGPESLEAPSRDTAAVVEEMFRRAERSILVAGYVVYQGWRVFETLARRMDEEPELAVRMFLNVERKAGDTSLESEILERFRKHFREKEWPGKRLPALYYDPRSLAVEPERRSCLHAKCIVADRRVAFVSSANFTEAAQERNIEVGVFVQSIVFADHLERHFDGLARSGELKLVG